MPWAQRGSKPVPNITSRAVEEELIDYSKGINRYIANDAVDEKKYLYLAQDARMPTLGEYETRKGTDFHSDSVGVTQDQTQTSTTGAADKSFSETVRLAQPFTAGSSNRITKVDVRLKNDASATGTIVVELRNDSSGSPGSLLSKTTIASSSVTSSYAYVTARYIDAPSVTSGTQYWIICYVQSVGSGSYKWSSTTSATTAFTSTDSGSTWSSTTYALNFKQYYSTSGGTKGLHRAYKSDGTATTLIAHGTSLSSADNSSGALTSIKTGLNATASRYRFCAVNDVVYYVNGYDGIRKWNFSADSQVSSTNATIVCEHKGLLFYADKDDPNKVFYSNFADYETFTSTDFIYVPSPKTGDPVVAMVSLSGALIIWTRRTKYILYGSDNATFQLDQAPATARNGTYTQETVASDANFAYFLAPDGVYRFNGTTDELISADIYDDVTSIQNKDRACLSLNRGRLRMYYSSPGAAANDSSIVFNTNFKNVESFDTNTYVARAFSAFNDSDQLLVASSLVGQAFWQENDSNDYTNLGGDINFYLQTHYLTWGTPSRYKELRVWKPRFGSQSGSYAVTCEYAYDLRDNPQTEESLNVQGSGSVWGSSSTVWGSFTWGTTPEFQSDLSVPGEHRRIQIRYKHYASRQPHKFLGHYIEAEIRKQR